MVDARAHRRSMDENEAVQVNGSGEALEGRARAGVSGRSRRRLDSSGSPGLMPTSSSLGAISPTFASPSGIEVDVGPAEPGELAAPHPHRELEHPERVQTIVKGRGEEAVHFVGGPGLHLGCRLARRPHPRHRAPRDKARVKGVVTGLAQHPVDGADRGGRQRTTRTHRAGLEQVRVQTSKMERVEVRERHCTDARVHVPADDPRSSSPSTA